MNFWETGITAGEFFLDFAWLGSLLIAGLYLREKISFLQKYLIPANLVGGVIGLMIGTNGFGLIDLTSERLGIYVYHLLALLFIGLGLRSIKTKIGLSSIKTGMIFIITYLVQGILGLLIAFALIYTLYPNLFAGIGLLPPLAFGMNPGIAFTIGETWEGFGFESGGIVGLTFSAIGFIAAYTSGVWIVKKGDRNAESASTAMDPVTNNANESMEYNHYETLPSAGRLTTSADVLESLSFHIGLIGFTYILTYLLMQLSEYGLNRIGAGNEADTLWAFHFIFAAILALGVRKAVDRIGLSSLIDDITMTRISNLFMDLMIAASVAAISLAVVGAYWLPLLMISLSVIFTTWWTLRKLIYSVFPSFKLERFAAIYGNMTGTLQSGLLLLRIVDEKMKTPVSYNLVYGSGLALVLGFPLLLLINAPVHYFENVALGFAVVLFVMALYLVLLLIGLLYINGRKE